MAGQPSPVTPSVVEWAVAEDGRALLELAEKLAVDEDTIAAWTRGEAKPTVGQVTRLADLLRRPRALFFLPAPPEGATLPITFRHPPGAAGDVSQKARLEVRRARRVQDAMSWALRDREPIVLPRHELTENPEAVGESVRNWVGVSIDEQAGWSGGEYPSYNGWRAALDSLGILVFSIEIGRGDVRGFSSWDEQAPLIAVNVSSVSPSARVFTIGHELGHLVTRTDAACLEPQGLVVDVDVERWCEQFAASFLMPADEVRQMMRSRGVTEFGARIDDVRAVLNYFHVSARAAALRLIGLGYAKPRLYIDVEAIFRPRDPAPVEDMKRPPRHVRRESQFGQRALREILTALPDEVALRVLRMTVEDARRIAERIPGVDARF